MTKFFTTLIILFCASLQLYAKDGYQINVNISNNTDKKIYLCHYYGKGQTVYKDDSASVEGSTAIFTLESDKKIVGGIYMLLFAERSTQFEMILNNGDAFSVTLDKNDPIKSCQFIGNTENGKFYEYQKFLSSIGPRFQAINGELATAKTKSDTAKINEKSKALNHEMKKYRADFVKKYPNTFSATVFNALAEPDVPEKNPMLPDGKTVDSTFIARKYKREYFEKFDFNDDRLIFTPLYENKLDFYFNKLTAPVPDSINKEADFILTKTKNSPDLFKYSLWWITRFAETNKVMGVDESFVYLVENYYQKGKAVWLADSNLEKYIDRARKISPTIVGNKIMEFNLPSVEGTPTSLSALTKQARYNMLIFWSPTCGHCQKEIPHIDSVCKVLTKKGVDIQCIGVESDLEDEKWIKMIKDSSLTKRWTHLHDPNRTGNFRANYDVYSTPTIYLLDSNGIILGKKIDHSNMAGLIEFLEKKRKKEEEEKNKSK